MRSIGICWHLYAVDSPPTAFPSTPVHFLSHCPLPCPALPCPCFCFLIPSSCFSSPFSPSHPLCCGIEPPFFFYFDSSCSHLIHLPSSFLFVCCIIFSSFFLLFKPISFSLSFSYFLLSLSSSLTLFRFSATSTSARKAQWTTHGRTSWRPSPP